MIRFSRRYFFIFPLFLLIVLVACSPAKTGEEPQQLSSPSPTALDSELPTKTFTVVPSSTVFLSKSPTPSPTEQPEQTITPTPSSTAPPMVTLTPKPSPTEQPEQTITPTPLPTASPIATLTPKPSSTASPTITLTPTDACILPTPEPLWVNPVTSPTNELSQIIVVYIGYGEEVTVTSESGSFTVKGSFDAHSHPAEIEIPLLPNTVHHLRIIAKVMPPIPDYCGGYTLETTRDRHDAPLTIVQGEATP